MISIDYGSSKDIDSWMRLVRTVSGSFPGLETNILCFLAVDPSFRRQHIAEKMFRFMLPQMNADKSIIVTTYLEGVPEGVAARAFYQKLGFVPGKLTVEFGSEVQEFALEVKQWQTY